MARLNYFDRLSPELLDKIIGLTLEPRRSNVLAPLKMIRLTRKEFSVAGLKFFSTLMVRDSTEIRHVKRIIQFSSSKLRTLDARLSSESEDFSAVLHEIGTHAWASMHLQGAARDAVVWRRSTQTLTKLRVDNWGKASRRDLQEEEWVRAEEMGDYAYFDSAIVGFPMLDASLVQCTSLTEMELIIEPLNLADKLRYAPSRLWRLKSVKLLRVTLTQDGESYSDLPMVDLMGLEYNMGLYLLSVAFPRVEHVVFPEWQMPIGKKCVLIPQYVFPDAWAGVRTLELGSEGLPSGKRVDVKDILDYLQGFNWPHVRTLIIRGTYITADALMRGHTPFRRDYWDLLRDKGSHYLEDLAMLVIEHPLIAMHEDGLPEDEKAAIDERLGDLESLSRRCLEELMQLPEVQAEGWICREMETRGTTALLTFHKDQEPLSGFSYQSYDRFSDYDAVKAASDTDTDQ